MLTLPTKFAEEISQKHATIYPFIIIGDELENSILISTVKEVIETGTGVDDDPWIYRNFKDYNLKISSIKDSLNIESHKISISNVTLTLSNYEIDGERLSDKISSLKLNSKVEVYYKSQSCIRIAQCPLIYTGTMAKVEHDSNTLKITLEDVAESLLDKEVPIANLGAGEHCLSKDYLNRDIPMTYGRVSKAPVVPYLDNIGNFGVTRLSLIADDVDVVTMGGRTISTTGFFQEDSYTSIKGLDTLLEDQHPLYIYNGDYFRVLKEYIEDVEDTDLDGAITYGDFKSQYFQDATGDFLEIDKIYSGGYPQNPPAMNELQTINVLFPNQTKLLVSEGDTAEQIAGISGYVVNLQPSSGILRPEAAIDNKYNPTTLLGQGDINEFSTFSQIPNNQPTIENLDTELEAFVTEQFSPYNPAAGANSGVSTIGWNDDTSQIEGVNYLFHITSWLMTNAHINNLKFIQLPPGDWLVDRAWNVLAGFVYDTIASGDKVEPGGSSFFITSGRSVRVEPQYAVDVDFRDAWCAASDVPNDLTTFVANHWYDSNNDGNLDASYPLSHEYFPSSGQDSIERSMNPEIYDTTNSNGNPFQKRINNKEVFCGEGGEKHYPSTVIIINCESFDVNGANITGIENVYIGQWMPSMPNINAMGNNFWFNIYYDANYPDIPYLLDNINKSPGFNPLYFTGRTMPAHKFSIQPSYTAEWNGVSINEYDGNTLGTGSENTYFAETAYAGGYNRYYHSLNALIKDSEIFNRLDASNGGNAGGGSWFVYAGDDIPGDVVMQDMTSDLGLYLGEYTEPANNTKIPKGCLIPCNHWLAVGGGFFYGNNGAKFSSSYSYASLLSRVNLTPGDENTAEQRLSVLFPFSDLSSQDVIKTNTFVYGALKVDIPPSENHDIDDGYDFLVQAIPTDIIEEGTVGDFNAEFPVDVGTNLIKSTDFGNDALFNTDGYQEISWNVNDGVTFPNDQCENILDHKIEEWDTPDSYNALSLIYRLRKDNADTSKRVQVSTNINSIGVVQFSVFENALNNEFYADVIGRADTEEFFLGTFSYYKYTFVPYTGDKIIIENPASVMYHLIDKELSLSDYHENPPIIWNAMTNNEGINLAFSVKEKINAKRLLEDISKSTNLYPKFSSNKGLSIAYIKSTYSPSDVDATIKTNDIIKFSFTRTPKESIYTLLNIKYSKDYGDDEYKKETGWCDAYDFYGNGEDGTPWLSGENNPENQGYDYSFIGINRESNIKEIESDYIRDDMVAENLRNYLFKLNANQHLIVKLEVPLSYMAIEVGDVVNFDKLYNNMLAFGEDYTSSDVTRNGQGIYPYFIITSVNKTSKTIKLECTQLHNLNHTFSVGKGSVTRRSSLGVYFALEEFVDGEIIGSNEWNDVFQGYNHITFDDLDLYEKMLIGSERYVTTYQKRAADITSDGSVDSYDMNIIQMILGEPLTTYFDYAEFTEEEGLDLPFVLTGDVNNDGFVNVTDIVSIVNYVMSDVLPTDADLLAMDFNANSIINVIDIVALVNIILGTD